MIKIIGGIALGVFVGSVLAELLRHTRPDFVSSIEDRAKDVTDRIFDGVKDAYDFSENEV